MNENIDLKKILDGCPKGTNFWSPVFGDITFEEISYSMKDYPLIFSTYPNDPEKPRLSRYFTKNGCLFDCYPDAELVIFPSKNQRDWSKFVRFWDKPKIERFDPKTLKPFQRVLVRDTNIDVWQCEMFSHFCSQETTYPFFCCGSPYYYCIPYNSETEHLVGTTEEAPEYYRYWEDE